MTIVDRGPRVPGPPLPEGEIRLQAPPPLPRPDERNRLLDLLPLTTMLGSTGLFFMPGVHRVMYVLGGLMLLSSLAVLAAGLLGRGGGERAELRRARRDHLRHLARVRRDALDAAAGQRAALTWNHPPPGTLWSVVADRRRLWERRRGDEDFAHVRLGTGPQRLARTIVPPVSAPPEELDPLSAQSTRRLLDSRAVVPGLPFAVSLRSFSRIVVRGDRGPACDLVSALLGQLAAFHAPDDLVVCVAAGPDRLPRWEWVKWLPHARHRVLTDPAGPARLVTTGVAELLGLLEEELAPRGRFTAGAAVVEHPHVVIVLDAPADPPGEHGDHPAPSVAVGASGGSGGRGAGSGADHGAAGGGLARDVPGAYGYLDLAGVTVVELAYGTANAPPAHPPTGTLDLHVTTDAMTLRRGGPQEFGHDGHRASPDRLGPAQAEALARELAPLRLSPAAGREPLLAEPDLAELLALSPAANGVMAPRWGPRAAHERLRVPLGVGENGQTVHLDLKEAALDGMGPHGLCVGATGSGKSELLRTLVLGLALTHDPGSLNMVLADFKGGATFAGLATLPHVSAVITNLADDLALVDRMRDALTGELTRRQEVLRAGGNHANVHDHERARAAGADLPPLPSLLVVIDEFSELLAAKPDFIDMFLQIGRIGRSLGVHLLLASQRLEEGRLRGLDTYLSYRIALRTFSAAESRAAIGVPDAFHLPPLPGSALLTFATDPPVRLKAAYVSGPRRAAASLSGEPSGGARAPVPFTAIGSPARPAPGPAPGQARDTGEPAREAAPAPAPAEDTFLDLVVRALTPLGPPAHPVWLPPLGEPPTLGDLLAPGPGAPPGPPLVVPLVVPLGVVDRPREQRRDVLLADLSGAAGNVLVVGGPRSGKSTLLRTIVSSFALTHAPGTAQFYCLDLTGGGLSSLEELPNVGSVAGRLDGERVRRVVARIRAVLDRRETLFRDSGIDSVTAFRAALGRGERPDGPWGDVFLVVDGWSTLRADFEALEAPILDVAARGLGFGVHVVVSAGRWADVRPALRDTIGTRLELRLGDPGESEADRRAAAAVPPRPGRGLTLDGAHFLTALPRADHVPAVFGLADAAGAIAARARRTWPGEQAPPVLMLPALVTTDRLPGPEPRDRTGHGVRVPIGLDESDLAPVHLDLEADPHFVVYGSAGSGRTNLLRALARAVCARRTPDQARFIVGDVRRTLLGAVPDTHLLAYAASAPALATHLAEAAGSFSRRLPGPDVTTDQLRARSWWTGPELFLLVDDYDLVGTASGTPLAPLVEFLPLARDIGLHVVVARSSGGAGRAQFEPVLQRLRDLGTQGLVMDGTRDEGPLVGDVRPGPQPPGRGHLVTRRSGVRLVQTVWDEP